MPEKRGRHRRGRGGFVLTEVLLALSIIVCLIPVTLVILSALIPPLDLDQSVQDEIALAQLRRILSMSYARQLDGEGMTLRYEGKEMRLSFINRRLILQPGTQIFLVDLDACSLIQKGDSVYVVYERNGKQKEKVLAKTP